MTSGYLLQAAENQGSVFGKPGDILVDLDFRKAYEFVNHRGTQRRIKDKEKLAFYVSEAKKRLAEQQEREKTVELDGSKPESIDVLRNSMMQIAGLLDKVPLTNIDGWSGRR